MSSPREREKRDRRESRGDEREGQGRKRNRNESEETEEIKTFPLYPYPREVLKTKAGGRSFQHLPRDLANVNALKNHVRSLLLHKNQKHLLHFQLFLALFCFAFSPMSQCNFHGLCSF